MVDYIQQGDCLELMKNIPDKSIDMILCDLPYGTTACKWDSIIPFEPLWEQYKRIIKDGGAIVLTAREPFTSLLVTSNIKWYKHKWVWNKKQSGSFQNAKYMPLQIEEDIIVFAKGKVNYYPQMRKGKMRKRGGAKEKSRVVGSGLQDGYENYSDLYYPTNIIELANPRKNKLHPTQKPVALCEWLIKAYTNENDLVLDNCMGSGSTCVAAINTNRHYIGFELEPHYFEIAQKRIEDAKKIKGG
jgi:site-specific DNA-methyltransferase (adenine-specific)